MKPKLSKLITGLCLLTTLGVGFTIGRIHAPYHNVAVASLEEGYCVTHNFADNREIKFWPTTFMQIEHTLNYLDCEVKFTNAAKSTMFLNPLPKTNEPIEIRFRGSPISKIKYTHKPSSSYGEENCVTLYTSTNDGATWENTGIKSENLVLETEISTKGVNAVKFVFDKTGQNYMDVVGFEYNPWPAKSSSIGTLSFVSNNQITDDSTREQGQTIADSKGNEWNVKTIGTHYFKWDSANDYTQVGAGSEDVPESITFKMVLPKKRKVTTLMVQFGGYVEANTEGNIILKVDDTVFGTGALSGGETIYLASSSVKEGETLTMSIENISENAIKCYSIGYIYEDTVQTFINTYMHMNEHETGQCITYYPIAKKAFAEELSDSSREAFLTDTQYIAAANRFRDWARAHGDIYSKKDGAFIHDPTIYNNIVENNVTIIAVSASIAVVAIVTVLVIAIRKRKKA